MMQSGKVATCAGLKAGRLFMARLRFAGLMGPCLD
jgi:hypothetical protein